MGNAAVTGDTVKDACASGAIHQLTEYVQQQMKELKAAGKLNEEESNKGVQSCDQDEVSKGRSGELATAQQEMTKENYVPAKKSNLVSIKVPRNLAKILHALQQKVANIEDSIPRLHSEQMLGHEAIDCILTANAEPEAVGLPYFVFDALDVSIDDDPFPALSQRPIQVLRAQNFIMQETRTARLLHGLKSPLSKGLRELHFINCEWDLIQSEDVAQAVEMADMRISVLNLSHSQKLRGDTFAGFARAFKHLRTLNVEHCQHIDDKSVVCLADCLFLVLLLLILVLLLFGFYCVFSLLVLFCCVSITRCCSLESLVASILTFFNFNNYRHRHSWNLKT